MGSGSDGRRLSTKTRRNGSGDNRVYYPSVRIGGCVPDVLAGRIQRLGFPSVPIWESENVLPMQQKCGMFQASQGKRAHAGE